MSFITNETILIKALQIAANGNQEQFETWVKQAKQELQKGSELPTGFLKGMEDLTEVMKGN
jgi:cellobiose-specific phosphotransferase system component IIA